MTSPGLLMVESKTACRAEIVDCVRHVVVVVVCRVCVRRVAVTPAATSFPDWASRLELVIGLAWQGVHLVRCHDLLCVWTSQDRWLGA